jgi:hypothetical protein
MNDYQTSLEKLRTDAAEAAQIRDLATYRGKRELFDRLAGHLSSLADGRALTFCETSGLAA